MKFKYDPPNLEGRSTKREVIDMTDTVNTLRFYTDETSAPYSDKDNPFSRTKNDDEFDKMIIEKYKLTTKEKEKLAIE